MDCQLNIHLLWHFVPVPFWHPPATSRDFRPTLSQVGRIVTCNTTPILFYPLCDISSAFLCSILGSNCHRSPRGASCDISSHWYISTSTHFFYSWYMFNHLCYYVHPLLQMSTLFYSDIWSHDDIGLHKHATKTVSLSYLCVLFRFFCFFIWMF
jgi:hypothetical protein